MKIGIDLGTTNSALAYIDPREAGEADFPPIHILEIPQLVAEARTEPRRTLPSFLYLAEPVTVGLLAREQGALVPTRSVHSAKSWLSNSEAERTAKILPWDAQEGGRVMSPVEVSAKILAHLGEAWNRAWPDFPIAGQDVVLTVPASFDEEARELTVMAARQAGLEKLTLLEEPAAAFYSWIANHLSQSQKSLFDGQTVLVCDVGGGTSDFTVIRVSREGDRVDFTRTAVGKHLLLGGDNLDLTLAWLVEAKLGKPLSVRQRSALRRQCASAKEHLLTEEGRKSAEITVLGGGSALIGGTLRTEILKEEAVELAIEGFLPFCRLGEEPKEEKKSLFRELGLPYVSDPAVTRHLSAFLGASGVSRIDAILFNGGFFIPEICRQRVTAVVEQWYGVRPAVFENQDLDLAVAAGASYYCHVRGGGSGVLVRGGLPRAYFIGVGTGEQNVRTVCLAPRGAEEGATLDLEMEGLQLVANRPVSFRLYSSLTRTDDQLGDVVAFTSEEVANTLHNHAPLNAVIRFGKKIEERLIPVKLGARLTEVGTLEIWAQSKVSEQRWRLEFELRRSVQAAPAKPSAVVGEDALVRAEEMIAATFGRGELPPEELPGRLEQAMALGRNSWPSSAIRRLADKLLDLAAGRSKGPAYEARWLNLTGFCLRPGFGFPGDDLRIEQARRVYAAGLQFANQVQCEIEWWIFWGRVAGGLNRNQQVDVFHRLATHLLPRGQKKQRRNSSLLREMWRAAASMELLPTPTRMELGDALLKRVKTGDYRESELWCISRLGARRLFYGPINMVLPPASAARWVEALVKVSKAHEAIAALAQRTGDATRDLPEQAMALARRALDGDDSLLAVLDGDAARDMTSLGRIFGEDLPSGLVFSSEP